MNRPAPARGNATWSSRRLHGSGPEPFEACPDSGRCWHSCTLVDGPPEGKGLPCWRVLNAGPFSDHNAGAWTPEERAAHQAAAAAEAKDAMCPGDTDFCPHGGCTTCQGQLYHFPDPDRGAGRIDERDPEAWAAYLARHRQRQEQQ